MPAVEISGAADDDIEMIDFMLGNGEADDVPMQNVDQSPLDGDTDSSKLMMTANMLHQTAQTREVISHAIRSCVSSLVNTTNLFFTLQRQGKFTIRKAFLLVGSAADSSTA